MGKFGKALGAFLAAVVAALGAGLADGALSLPEGVLAAVAGVAAGLAAYGVKNAGFVDVDKLDALAGAAYEAYRAKVGGVAFNGDKLPDWSYVDQTIKDAWKASQAASQ